MLFSSSLIASTNDDTEVLSYSDFNVNETLSLYAGKINMDYFLEDEAYSVGLLLHEKSQANLELGLGYIQPSSKFVNLSENELDKVKAVDEDGVLFFINYSF